jgi:predicted nucleotidyltransferase
VDRTDASVRAGYRVGSRATGNHKRFSDVDLLIESDDLTGVMLGRIAEAFEESSLPYKVDLVDVRKLAPAYVPSVMASRRILFEI